MHPPWFFPISSYSTRDMQSSSSSPLRSPVRGNREFEDDNDDEGDEGDEGDETVDASGVDVYLDKGD